MSSDNKMLLRLHALWLTLTEVPGWPDAPRAVRIRRALPIALPVAGMLLVALWGAVWIQPHFRRTRAEARPLVMLAQEVNALRSAGSEDEAAAAADRAAQAVASVFATSEEAEAALPTLRQQATTNGWTADWQLIPRVEEVGPAAGLTFVDVRGKLSAAKGNTAPYSSLLAYLEGLSKGPKRIELTRTVIRADELGRYTAEINLRLACQSRHP